MRGRHKRPSSQSSCDCGDLSCHRCQDCQRLVCSSCFVTETSLCTACNEASSGSNAVSRVAAQAEDGADTYLGPERRKSHKKKPQPDGPHVYGDGQFYFPAARNHACSAGSPSPVPMQQRSQLNSLMPLQPWSRLERELKLEQSLGDKPSGTGARLLQLHTQMRCCAVQPRL
jgi:hypothetical protein